MLNTAPQNHVRARLLLACLAFLLLGGCANPMYRQARRDCEPEAFRIFPLVVQTQRISEPLLVQVPDGTQQCMTDMVRQGDHNTSVTRCVPNYTLQTRWVDRWTNVDLNARERNIWMERCAQDLCVQRAGNPACEEK